MAKSTKKCSKKAASEKTTEKAVEKAPKTCKGEKKACCKKVEVKKPLTKTQIISDLADQTQLTKKQVSTVLDSLITIIGTSMGTDGAGSFIFPGLLKIEKKEIPASPERKNVPDRFHPGQFRDVPAKPAHNKVKIKALKGLKDMV